MPHDQLMKEVLRAFFREFIELFFPSVAGRLDFSRVTFLDKELFTDLPEGSRREADLVAMAHTLEGEPELILVHIEVQAQREREFPYRMFEYYAMLRLRHKRPVFPVVIYLRPGSGGITSETYEESLFEANILSFRYAVIGIPDLSAEDFLGSENALAAGLGALMRPGKQGRARHKFVSLQRAAEYAPDAARQSLLVKLIESYLELNDTEDDDFRRIIQRPEGQEVKNMLLTTEDRGILKGKRNALLRQMRLRFGALPTPLETAIAKIELEDELDNLLDRVITAKSLEEMGLTVQ